MSSILPSVVEIKSSSGLGSGVVFDSAGHIVTNAHVVGRDTEFVVRLSTGAELPATLLSSFPPDDIAVITTRGGVGLVPAQFGRSAGLRAGDIVMAMGNPLGLDSSVTDGIVSAVGRTVPEPAGQTGPGTVLRQAIQTSAAINPGNSGGALVDASGQVVGIPTLAVVNPELGSAATGIGFAVPSDVAADLATQMIAHGRVVDSHRASLGIAATTVTNPDGTPSGVEVVDVRPGGPAAAAEVRPGDLIVAIAGEKVTDVITMQAVLTRHNPGERIVAHPGNGIRSRQSGERAGPGLPRSSRARGRIRHGLRPRHHRDPLVRRCDGDGRVAQPGVSVPAPIRHGPALGSLGACSWCCSPRSRC